MNRVVMGMNRVAMGMNRVAMGMNRVTTGINRVAMGMNRVTCIPSAIAMVTLQPYPWSLCSIPMVSPMG